MNIFLIGYRCTGKSSIAGMLAKALNWSSVDADEVMVAEIGMTVAEFVAQNGWGPFREKEKEILAQICAHENQVVATGGGVILDRDNVVLMRNKGTVVWLKATKATILQRMIQDLQTDDLRPALTAHQSLDDEIEETLAQRRPLYEGAMSFAIDTDTLDISQVTQKITEQLKKSV